MRVLVSIAAALVITMLAIACDSAADEALPQTTGTPSPSPTPHTPTPAPSPTASPTPTLTVAPTAAPTLAPKVQHTDVPTPVSQAIFTATPTPAPTQTPVPTPLQLPSVLIMDDYFFDYAGAHSPSITVPSGVTVVANLRNDGFALHNVQVANAAGVYGEDICTSNGTAFACSNPATLLNGEMGALTVTFSAPGSYPFRCDYHAAQMKGTFVVQ
jgi:plastocyanin